MYILLKDNKYISSMYKLDIRTCDKPTYLSKAQVDKYEKRLKELNINDYKVIR